MHVNLHAITFIPIDCGGYHNQRILSHEIPDTSHTALISSTFGLNIEFQCLGTGKKNKKAARCAQQRLSVHHVVEYGRLQK
jgi:hypothetical protein